MNRLLSMILIAMTLSCGASKANHRSYEDAVMRSEYEFQRNADSPCITFDYPDSATWDLRPYAQVAQSKVLQYWHIPETLEVTKAKGWVAVCFVVENDGTITNLHVSRSSGNKTLDRAAIDALRRSSPLPPIPADVVLPRISGTFRFYYNMPIPK